MAGQALRATAVGLLAGAVLGGAVQLSSDPPGSAHIGASVDDRGLVPAATVLGMAEHRSGPGAPMEAAALRDLIEHSVLLTEVHACGTRRQATVTLISAGETPVGITNAHVVRGTDRLEVRGAALGVGEAMVTRWVAGRDAAVVDLTGLDVPEGTGLVQGDRPAAGDRVTVAGFPSGRWSAERGTVQGWTARRSAGSVVKMFTVDVPTDAGGSGGVVVGADGAAVGLVTERDPRTGQVVALPLAGLRSLPAEAPLTC